jgi:hypothetical protein
MFDVVMEEEFPSIPEFQKKFKELIFEIQSCRFQREMAQFEKPDRTASNDARIRYRRLQAVLWRRHRRSVRIAFDANFITTNAYASPKSTPFRLGSGKFKKGSLLRLLLPAFESLPNGSRFQVYNAIKFHKALLANTIHTLDASLLFFIIECSHSQGISRLPLHDGVWSDANVLSTKLINLAYWLGIRQIFRKDPMRTIVKSNGVAWKHISASLRAYFQRIHCRRRRILAVMKSQDIL